MIYARSTCTMYAVGMKSSLLLLLLAAARCVLLLLLAAAPAAHCCCCCCCWPAAVAAAAAAAVVFARCIRHCLRVRVGWDNREIEVGCRLHNLDSMRVDSTQHTHRGACAGWGRSRECSHQSDAQRRLRAEIRSSVRARCRLPRVARVSLSLRCARAPFGQRVREARIEGGCASRRTLRMPLFRYQGSSRAGGKESSPSKGCFHTLLSRQSLISVSV